MILTIGLLKTHIGIEKLIINTAGASLYGVAYKTETLSALISLTKM